MYPCNHKNRVMDIQDEAFIDINAEDKAALLNLGWWTNDYYLWRF
jgi:hypothetical protein